LETVPVMTLSCRKTSLWVVLLALGLLGIAAAPHAHFEAVRSLDDCVLCHVHHAPVVASQPAGNLPELVAVPTAQASLDAEERDAVLGRHPSRAPPA
jgi:hypothetical protein